MSFIGEGEHGEFASTTRRLLAEGTRLMIAAGNPQ
jgi:hypothetical protein